jgi:CDP-diacylglycerol--serine O-phosphatidyltransferase
MDDPLEPRIEQQKRRRRHRVLFRHRQVPVRLILPNLFTVLSLCAGLTAIRMAIEKQWDVAVWLVVLAALLDGVDGRMARALKAQSRFGAELDSLADHVNFGVAPALILFMWSLSSIKGFGWIVAMIFAAAMGLRLARFNASIEVEKPKWQSNYFTGMPAPAGAITAMLPLYLHGLGPVDVQGWPVAIAIYLLLLAFLTVSTIPTFSGKLLGERIGREWVLPILVGVALAIGLLVTYPHATLAVFTIGYLAVIPYSWSRFQHRVRAMEAEANMSAATAAGTLVSLRGDESKG